MPDHTRRLADVHVQSFRGTDLTDDILQQAATLFSEHYGIWGRDGPAPGKRVQMSLPLMRRELLPIDNLEQCRYVRATNAGELVGNAFACRWVTEDGVKVCWITQLVVNTEYRNRGIASRLLAELKEAEGDCYGIMSSHPFSCLAALRTFAPGTGFGGHLDAMKKDEFKKITTASPIQYVRGAHICDGQANTLFFVDHAEPQAALEVLRKRMEWPYGDLQEGHEYLVLIKTQ